MKNSFQIALLLTPLFLSTMSAKAQLEPQADLPTVDFERFLDTAAYAPGGIVMRGPRFIVSDFKGNRLLYFGQDQRLVKTVGTIGSEKGDLLRPTSLALSPKGDLYVRELGNQRIQIFAPDDSSVGTVPLTGFVGFTVNNRGEILVGNPEEGELISVVDRDGKRVRGFGALRTVSGLYGKEYAENDQRDANLINRVALAYDNDEDSLYAVFLFVGLVQKYDRAGKLVWEKRIQGPHMERLEHLFLIDEERTGHRYVRTIMDGRAANYVTSAIAASPARDEILVLLPGRVLVQFDRQGNQKGTYQLQAPEAGGDGKEFNPSAVAVGAAGRILLADPFFNAIWAGTLDHREASSTN